MIVTSDSDQGRKSVVFNRNRRSRSVGRTGHVQAESAVNFVRPGIRIVTVKSNEQLDLQALHCIRERLVRQRTSIA
jgi:hypothetical protein